MTDLFKLGAQDAFLDRAANIDPFFRMARKRWHVAKAHVAKGHEQEKERLETEGRRRGAWAGGVTNAIAGALMAKGMGPVAAATAALTGGVFGAVTGGLSGHAIGGWEAERRLALSQARGEHGHYRPGPNSRRKLAFAMTLAKVAPATRTATAGAMGKIEGMARTVKPKVSVKPPAHKPTVKATPQPATPQVAPSTITPSQPPVPGMTKVNRLRRRMRRDRTSAGEPPTGGRAHRPGENMAMRHPSPSNNPVTYDAGKPHDF